jgi:hypothetical protein
MKKDWSLGVETNVFDDFLDKLVQMLFPFAVVFLHVLLRDAMVE